MMDARGIAQAGLGCLCVATVNLLLMCVLRAGLETAWFDVMKLLLMIGAACVSPLLLADDWRKPEWAALVVIALLNLVCLFPLIGDGVWLVYGGVFIMGARKALPHAEETWLWRVFGALGLYIFLRSHMEHFAGVYAPEFGRMGILHRDTQLQAAFANMIGQFGAFSVGEGSLAATPYHVGVNVWMAFSARALDMDVVAALPFLLRLVVFPVLVFSILLSVPERVHASVAGALVLAALVATELLGFYSVWFSESYVYALVFLFLGLACVPGMLAGRWGALGVFALCAGMAQLAKLSVGLLLIGLVCWVVLRSGRLVMAAGVCALGVAAAAYTVLFQLPAGGHHEISAFNFLVVYGPFISASCFVPLLCVWWLQRREKLLSRAVCGGLALLGLVAFVIPNTLVIISGSGWYFLDVARWAGLWAGLWWYSLSPYAAWTPKHWVGAMRGHVRKPHYFALLLLGTALADGMVAFKATVDEAQRMAAGAQELPGGGLLGGHVAGAAAQGYGAKMLSALAQEERRANIAVYVPRNSAYWAWPEKCEGNQGKYSATQGYFFQAMAGMPILNPYPYDESPCAFRYSEYVFGHEALQPPDGEPDVWLCEAAQRAGFSALLVLEGTMDAPVFRRLACAV